jgi:hypothetical protein
MQFPSVKGKNLDRETQTFPADFEANLNLVFIAFQQWQQASINTWLPFAASLEQERDDLMYYEFPTIQAMNPIFRTFINEGMRAGIPDPKSRQRTVTLYLDKEQFRASLEMEDEEHIFVLLVRQDGDVLWRTRGEFSEEKAGLLRTAIKQIGAESSVL